MINTIQSNGRKKKNFNKIKIPKIMTFIYVVYEDYSFALHVIQTVIIIVSDCE